MEAFIYALCDPCSHEIRYVGKTQTSIKQRLAQHINDKSNTYRGKWLRGLKEKQIKPAVHILEITRDWVEAEQFWIAYFKSLGARLANATIGGEGACGYKPSKETLAKLSAMRKGHMVSEETRKAISEKAKGNKRALGVKRSDEFKAGVSKRLKGTKTRPDVLAHLSAVRKGKPWTEKQRQFWERGDRKENYAKINKLFSGGDTKKEIAEKLGLPVNYVAKGLAAHPDKKDIQKQFRENRAKRKEVYSKMNGPQKSEKISTIMKGRKVSEETRRKMSESHKKRHMAKMREE